VWRVLGGYDLARLPFAMAMIQVHDPEALIEGLIAIRDSVSD
jgi:hypothetical protein